MAIVDSFNFIIVEIDQLCTILVHDMRLYALSGAHNEVASGRKGGA